MISDTATYISRTELGSDLQEQSKSRLCHACACFAKTLLFNLPVEDIA